MGGAGSFGLRPNPQTARNGPAWSRIRNSRAPAGFRPNGWIFGLQSRCRLGTFEPAKSKGDFGAFEPAKGNGWVWAGSFGPNPQTAHNGPAWARIRNSRAPAGFRPNGWRFGLQSRCRLGTFEPAKSKGWVWPWWGWRNGPGQHRSPRSQTIEWSIWLWYNGPWLDWGTDKVLKPWSEAFGLGWMDLIGPWLDWGTDEVLKPWSEAFGLGWMDLIGPWLDWGMMRYWFGLQKHWAGYSLPLSPGQALALSFPLASPSSLGEGSADFSNGLKPTNSKFTKVDVLYILIYPPWN